MTKIKVIILSIALFSLQAVFAQKSATLTIKFSFANIVDGYDHNTYCEIWIDGVKVGESTGQNESIPNSVTVETTPGKHTLEVKNYAEYAGEWEEHTIENNFSIDCYYSAQVKVKKTKTIKLLFDIDAGTKLVK